MVQICSIPHSAAGGCSTLGARTQRKVPDWDRWRENGKTVPEISLEMKKRQERGFEWLSGLPFLLLLLHWDPFDASSAPVKARAQLDRDQFYSKLQHLIKRLACPREKISSRKGPLSKGNLAWCLIWFKEVKFKTVKWMIATNQHPFLFYVSRTFEGEYTFELLLKLS